MENLNLISIFQTILFVWSPWMSVTFGQETDSVHLEVEAEPSFPGGESAMMTFIQENINYPMDAIELCQQGTVYVSFVVRKNGEITDVKVVRGAFPSLDREAMKVVENMPGWIAGMQDGKTVSTMFTLPISFRISGCDEEKKGRKKK